MRHYLFIIWLIAIFNSLYLQAQELKFNTLTKEGLLDRQSILCITQDEQGRIIFGGQRQLFYFDSYHIDKLNLDKYLEKEDIYIEHIITNEENKLFIGSREKLLIYDLFTKSLVENGSKPWSVDIPVLKLEKIHNQIYLLSQNGLYTIDSYNGSFKATRRLKIDNPHNLTHIANNRYIIANHNDIYEITIKGSEIKYVRNLKIPKSNEPVTSFYSFPNLYIGTKANGVFVYDFSTKIWKNYTAENSSLLSNNVRKIVQDDQGNVLIGTLRGLSIFNIYNESFTNYRHESINKQSLSQNSIYDIYIDNQSNIWLGTYFGGLNYVFRNPYNITTYSPSYNQKSKLNSEIISSIAESKDHIWIATEEEGIAKLNKNTLEITPLTNLTKSNLIKDIYIKDDKLYIAQVGIGFSIYDINTNKINHYSYDKSANRSIEDVNRIFVDNYNNIYLSSFYGVLVSSTDEPSDIKNILPTSTYAFEDASVDHLDNTYVLSNSKLYTKNFKEQSLKLFEPTKYLDVRAFYIENDSFWLVTNQEILKLTADNKLSKVYQFKNTSNARIVAYNNKLWIARNEGIFCFDLKTSKIHLITQQDGLLVKNLENSRLFLASNGQMFVPSLNGLMSFYPDQVTFNDRIPQTILQNIQGSEEHPILFERLKKVDNNSYQLTLNHNENNFIISFASNNLSKPLKNKFKYKLEGFETQWNETSIPDAKYSNIDPGKYTLRVLSSNNDNVWSTETLNIAITVKPPFWLTWWAYMLYGIAALTILHFTIKFIVEREILINSEKEHQKKINFFTQISHEIRTPLTLITAPIDDILEASKADHETTTKLFRLKKNANKLLNIVNELLDFKKIDAGKDHINPLTIESKTYLEDLFYLFSDLAVSKQMDYYIQNLEENVFVNLDTRQFDKVIYNLLSNAIKYTPENGTVFLNTKTEKGIFFIEIWDSGIGVDKENEFKIFEEYYREKNAQDNIGTGIGLALTKKIVEQHRGNITCTTELINAQQFTCFRIAIPYSLNELPQQQEANSPEKNTPQRDIDDKELLLIVEDNIELHEVIENIFKEQFTILKAYDGQQGLKIANDYLPNLIISDVMMPNMDGIEMCELIKSNEKTAHIPIIMLTANTTEETQLKSLKYGSNVYLYKPFNPNILNLTVTNLLNLTNAKRQQFNIEKKELTLSEVDQKFLTKFENLIEGNLLNDSFGVEYLSKELGMSTPILYKKVKAITNLSVNNFVKTYRFRKAIALMKNGHNISEAAYAVGFSDRKYFSKEFKKTYGVSPSEYEENKEV